MHHNVKYSPETVEIIKQRHESGTGPHKLSEEFGIPFSTIRNWVYFTSRCASELEKEGQWMLKYPESQLRRAIRLKEKGMSNIAVGRLLQIPTSTISYWWLRHKRGKNEAS